MTDSPSCGKGSEQSYFYPSLTPPNMHKQTGLNWQTHTHNSLVNNAAGRHYTLLAPLSFGKPIPAVLCCRYITQSSCEAKWVRTKLTTAQKPKSRPAYEKRMNLKVPLSRRWRITLDFNKLPLADYETLRKAATGSLSLRRYTSKVTCRLWCAILHQFKTQVGKFNTQLCLS